MKYPTTKQGDAVDDYHGVRIADPYRWLEDLDAPETAEWVRGQNAVTFAYLDALPGRDALRERLTAMWNYPRVGLPFREGGRLFYARNAGLQRQSPYYVTAGNTPRDATLVLDPNAISEDGSVSLSRFSPDPSGRWVAYGLSKGGADWVTVKVRRLDRPGSGPGQAGTDLDDTVEWIRYSSPSWTRDGEGFFYTRYPTPPQEAGATLASASRDPAVYYHRLGTPQSDDVRVFDYPAEPTWGVGAQVSEDGRWLFASVSRGTDPENLLYVAELDSAAPDAAPNATLRPVDVTMEASFGVVGVVDGTAYVLTNLDAPKYRVVAIDLAHPARDRWRTVVAESDDTLEHAALVGGRIVAQWLADVKGRLTVHSLGGEALGEIPLPGIGAVAGLSGREDSPELYYGFTSFLFPAAVYRHDLDTGERETFFAPDVPFDPSPYETEQVFYASRDGTRVPMFVVRRKDMPRDGANPTLLYAYGGFNVVQAPAFSPSIAAWLECGGVFALANLRGGGEYGEAWHAAGKLHAKQNVFDDFIAAAEWLIANDYTSPSHLAIRGGSNGGLLVGAVMNQRPELFAAAIAQVGVMDMLRYHRFSAGVFWVPEYGSSDDAAQFHTLRAYSPLHNLRDGACYPATLITTADHDDRVVPGHSYKYAAALQAAQRCDAPVLIRVETQGSHNYRPLDRQIAEQADVWAFAAAHTGATLAFERTDGADQRN